MAVKGASRVVGDPEGRPEEPKGEQVKEGPQCALGALGSGPSGGRQNGWGVTDGASGGTERKCPKGLPGAELLGVPWEESLGEPSQRLGLKDGWRPRGGGAGGEGISGSGRPRRWMGPAGYNVGLVGSWRMVSEWGVGCAWGEVRRSSAARLALGMKVAWNGRASAGTCLGLPSRALSPA